MKAPAVGVLACFLAAPSTAQAQDESPPRVDRQIEIGASAAMYLWNGQSGSAPGVRVSVANNPRFAFEVGIDSLDFGCDDAGTVLCWLYFLQMRHTLWTSRRPGSRVFATYGTAGLFERTRTLQYTDAQGRVRQLEQAHTFVSLPFFATAGFGGQRAIAKYLAIRGEYQVLIGLFYEDITRFTGRFSVAVAVPLPMGN